MTTTTNTVRLEAITVGDNVRHGTGDVSDLAASIDRVGLLNPLTVRLVSIVDEDGEGDLGVRVELVAGHRRLAALLTLGWEEAPVVYLDPELNDGGARLAVQLVENLQRSDLTPIEEAEGLAALVEAIGSQGAAADAIGRSKGHVSKRLKLLTLPDDARAAIDEGTVTLEQGFELAKVEDPKTVTRLVGLLGGGVHPATAAQHLADAVRATDRDRQSRKAARDVARQDHRTDVEVVASPDVPKAWRRLDGWDGLAVDFDDHHAEPCHRLAVGFHDSWAAEVSERHYCAEPARHDPDGESPVKVVATDTAGEEAARALARAAERAAASEADERRTAAALNLAAGTSDRNAVLKALATYTLAGLTEVAGPAFAAAGVELPPEPAGRPWDNPDGWRAYNDQLEAFARGEGITTAQHYRAALGAVLLVGPANRYVDDAWAPAVAELVGFDRAAAEEASS